MIDGKKNLIQIVDELEEVMQNKSLAELCESTSSVSCMAVPRRQGKYLHVLTDIEQLRLV